MGLQGGQGRGPCWEGVSCPQPPVLSDRAGRGCLGAALRAQDSGWTPSKGSVSTGWALGRTWGGGDLSRDQAGRQPRSLQPQPSPRLAPSCSCRPLTWAGRGVSGPHLLERWLHRPQLLPASTSWVCKIDFSAKSIREKTETRASCTGLLGLLPRRPALCA